MRAFLFDNFRMSSESVSVGEDSTLESSLQPTNWPTNYVSMRVTLPHDKWSKMKRCVFHDCSYIAYPHSADTGTKKEHWHIAVPIESPNKAVVEKFRKRARDGLQVSGNEYLSCKLMSNGIQSFCQYASKERTVPEVSDDLVRCVATAPQWVQPTIASDKKPDRTERDWQLTYSNIVSQAVQYHRKSGLPTSTSLKDVVTEMIVKTKWRPSYHMVNHGIPEFYDNDFLLRIGARTVPDMSWWSHRI